jgi:DNA polymerase
MRMMAKPRKPRSGEDPSGVYWHDDPEKIARLSNYCIRDTDAEREVYHHLPPLTEAEQALWVLDAIINARGFYTDGPLLEAASQIATAADQAIQDELARITDGALTSTSQVEALQAWLADHGCEVKDIKKGTLSHALRRKDLDPAVRRVIELRREAAHAAASKIDTLLAWRNADGRVRGTLQFHGAGPGRWTGRGPQPQNFKRDSDDLTASAKRS